MIVSKKMHEFDKNYGIMKSHIRVKDMIFFISLRVFYKKITLILFLTVDFYKFLAIMFVAMSTVKVLNLSQIMFYIIP